MTEKKTVAFLEMQVVSKKQHWSLWKYRKGNLNGINLKNNNYPVLAGNEQLWFGKSSSMFLSCDIMPFGKLLNLIAIKKELCSWMQNGWKHTESVSNKMISQFRSLEELYKDASISLACILFYISVFVSSLWSLWENS